MPLLKILIIDTIINFVYFPLWWYSKGLVLTAKWTKKSILEVEKFLGIVIWAKNIFTPMFGQYDIFGRIISFNIRVFQIIVRTIIFLGLGSIYLALFFIYLILPVAVFCFILLHSLFLYG